MVIQDGAYVYHEINGHKAYVVADWTLNANWEVWTDSSMEYWRESFDQALDALDKEIGLDEPADGNELVDLGLPSGTLWAKCNVGATEETGYGNYYRYGKGTTQYDYNDTIYDGIEDPLASTNDTATQAMGAAWHMPTVEQCQELVDNTTFTWEIDFNGSGVNGAKFTAANGKYLFLPAAGNYRDGYNTSLAQIATIWTNKS